MIRRAIVLAAANLAATITSAAAQSSDSPRERIYQRYWDFASSLKGGSIQPNWLPDGKSFWYADHAPDSTVIYRVDPAANSKTPLFDVARARLALESSLGHRPAYRGLPFSSFTWVDPLRTAKVTVDDRDFVLDLSSYSVREVPAPTAEERDRSVPHRVNPEAFGWPVMELPSPDGRWFATAKNQNLWLRSTQDGRVVPLTEDGIENYEWNVGGGLSIRPPVARWSPDGSRLAAYRVDSRKVQRQPLVHWLTSREEVDLDLNPLAGGELPQVEVYVIDVLSRRTVRVETGDQRDQYLYLIGWRPDGRELLYYRMSRDFRRLDLLAADPNTGKSRVILTETSKTFVEGYTDWPSLLFTPLWDRQQFLWLSERDGWEHIYLYGFDGQLVRCLTTGAFPVQRIVSVDRKAGWIYFSANSDPHRPYDSHLHRVNLEGQGFARLTKESGQHSVVIAPSGEYFLDTHADLDRPAKVELMRADGTPLQVLAAADTSALAPLRRQPIERFVVKAADGITDLYGVLFKPFDFDPKRKYPVIEVFYPGDQTNIVPRTFDLNYYGVRAQAWAQLGFITFLVDARGTPGRGKAFQDVVYLNHGKNEIPDHAAVVKQLVRQRPYMDSTRVGVWGHSWGGYFAIRAMLLAPDVYQVGVASAPLADLDATYWPTEPYMLTPQENAAGYDYARNTRFADRLKGKLLMIVGSNDGAHLMGHVLRQAEAFIRAGKLFDMMILPEQNHGFTGASARFAEQYVRAYFDKNLRVADGAEPTSDR